MPIAEASAPTMETNTLTRHKSRTSLGGPPADASLLAAELAIVSMQRSLFVHESVIDVLHHLHNEAGPGASRLRRKATANDGLWSDLARPHDRRV